MAVLCTNISSFVLFLLMKLYLFLTLNHFTVLKTFVVKKTLSLQEGATDVRPIRPPLPTQLPVEPDLLAGALRVMVVEAE